MNRPVILLGGGGHARVLADGLLAAGKELAGYVAPADQGGLLAGIRWLGDDPWLLNQPPDAYALVNGLGSVAQADPRRRLFEDFRAAGFRFAQVVHPHALVSPSAALGEGCQVLPGAIVNTGARVGENTIVNTGAVVEHDCELGDHAHIAPGSVICGDSRIGHGVHVGAGAVIIQGIEIGSGAIIAAGAVVTRKVEPLTLVAGVPAVQRKKLASP